MGDKGIRLHDVTVGGGGASGMGGAYQGAGLVFNLAVKGERSDAEGAGLGGGRVVCMTRDRGRGRGFGERKWRCKMGGALTKWAGLWFVGVAKLNGRGLRKGRGLEERM